MITYDDIARMIEPVATREVDEEHEVMNIGDFILRRWGTGYWTILHPTAAQAADLACMELVRRLNTNVCESEPWPYAVIITSGEVTLCDPDGEVETKRYANHPLEAIAPFAAGVLKKETPNV